MIYRVIDKATGLFIEDKFEFNPETEIGLDVIPAQGFVHAKWDFVNECWIEGATPEEIEAMIAQQAQPTIDELKQQLADTDYKIIKCYEYQMAGLELPYDIQAIHAERQAIRDKIAELEGK